LPEPHYTKVNSCHSCTSPVGQEGLGLDQIIKGGTAAALPLKVIKEVFKEGVAGR